MRCIRFRCLAVVLVLAGIVAAPASAQRARISTVEGPGVGEKTTLSMFPHSAGEGLSVRAVGVSGRDTTRWTLMVIGVRTDTAAVRISANGTELAQATVTNPNPQTGPHQVSLTKEEFLTLSEAETAQMTVNGTTVPIPSALQVDMAAIFRKVV
jgi:hypothetical protein